MKTKQPDQTLLTEALTQDHVWRGWQSFKQKGLSINTGYDALNQALQRQGWPQGGLIEVQSRQFSHAEWLLFTPALTTLLAQRPQAFVALINPPHLPFAAGLIQQKLLLNQILIVQAKHKNDVIHAFNELSQSTSCIAALVWQTMILRYPELRKCQLHCHDKPGLYIFFKESNGKVESSPGVLKIQTGLQAEHLTVQILKQRGSLLKPQDKTLHLALPKYLSNHVAHRSFLDSIQTNQTYVPYQPVALTAPTTIQSAAHKRRIKHG